MIINIKKKKIPLVLLNGRINKKSYNKWKYLGKTAKFLFKQFDMCFPSSLESKIHLRSLGVKKTKNIGNLKFSQTEKDENFFDPKLRKFFLSKDIWCASSTHDSEEKFVAQAHKKIKKKYRKLVTIIIPRHIERIGLIVDELENLGLKVHFHSSKKKIKDNIDIYLVDTYGRTKSFYKICRVVFLGGSIIKHGGQNPLEPSRYGCKILHGPNIWNFYEIYKLLKEYDVSNKINNTNHLAQQVDRAFTKKNNTLKIRSKIKQLGDKILNSTFKEINTFIK